MQTSIGSNSTTTDDGVKCIESERQALLAFKQGLVDEHGRLSSWGSEEEKKNCCEWEGVQCSNKTGHITMLNLTTYSYDRHFILRVDLFLVSLQNANLASLQYLDLGYNNFNSVKNLEWLSRLFHLQYLGLSDIDLSKVNKDGLQVINKLHHLTNLSLYRCNLRDVIPQYFPIINTSSTPLIQLGLGSNNLTTSAFLWLFNFSNSLVSLDLSSNQFRGPIPETFGHMTPLEELYLNDNQFEGEIPKSFWSGNLSSLRYLLLSKNKLSGNIPKSIGLLSKLEALSISFNSFNGVITEEHFSTLSNLWGLDLSSNHLSINFSCDWIPPFQLKYILLGSCKLGPDFPSWLQTQRSYKYLNISATGISDSIPIWFGNLPSTARGLDLSSNQIRGILPDFSRNFSSDSYDLGIDTSGNHLEGPLPSFPGNTTHINLSKNSFNGSISSLCAMTDMSLEFLDLSRNQLFGELPDCMMRWSSLRILNLANNHFFGKIPSFVGSLTLIETFDLQNNSLSGKIPGSLRNCSKLQFLGLSNNRLSGIIPSWIGERLNSLNFLLLKSNYFIGEIPLETCQLTNILLLDLSNNSLSGHIPRCIGNLTALARKDIAARGHFFNYSHVSSTYGSYADKASVIWKGIEYHYENLTLQRTIDLSSNNLTGEIPVQISSLFEMHQLNLSRNHLIGRIPPDIGQIRQLESLDLSHNRLSGRLPLSMSQLYSLSKLDLSYNNFSGRIPTSTQMDTFNASAFAGNPTLCGPPLTPSCPGDEKLIDDGVKYNQQDKDEFWKAFQPSMKLGMAFGFLGVLALKIDHPWKHVCLLLSNYMKKTGPSSSSITASPSLSTLPNSFSDLAMTDSKSPSTATKHHSPTKAEAKAISLLYATGRTMVFAYGVTFAFVVCTAFLVPNPSSSSSPWIKNFLKSSSSSSRFSSLFFSFVSNSSQTDGNPLPFTPPPAAAFRVSWESSGFSDKNGSLSSDGESGVSEDVRVFNQTATLLSLRLFLSLSFKPARSVSIRRILASISDLPQGSEPSPSARGARSPLPQEYPIFEENES
ncbi:hypothetical protein SLEP1_g54756 [Rubroshorea leprosula]|uniref:Leucine-rich repeat-containing N-terminal plant-type domain-containing protein n=1 Tax=Rubroshorea leprosula TaxID=152421 RepID=A0AAV5MGJ7_9ROSI|nr:hypothetical protein SLEP1_g54756 [Rubroshorea leprosula]